MVCFKMTLFCPDHRGKGFALLPSNTTGLELLLCDHYSVRYILGASACLTAQVLSPPKRRCVKRLVTCDCVNSHLRLSSYA